MNYKDSTITRESRDNSKPAYPAWFLYGQGEYNKPETVTGFKDGLCFVYRKPKTKK